MKLFYVLLCIYIYPNIVFAIGGGTSSGCSGSNKALEEAVMWKDPISVGYEIDRSIEFDIGKGKTYRYGIIYRDEEENIQPMPIDIIRRAFVKTWRSCKGVLLDFAVAAGNVRNTEYLLDLGADPDGIGAPYKHYLYALGWNKTPPETTMKRLKTIFMRCSRVGLNGKSIYQSVGPKNIKEYTNTFAAYDKLIEYGADVNAQYYRGNETALHLCLDPNVIQFLIQNGADTSLTSKAGLVPLLYHLYHVVYRPSMYSSSISSSLHFEAAERLLSATDTKYIEEGKIRICQICTSGKFTESCARFSKLLPEMIALNYKKKELTDERMRRPRCFAINDPECVSNSCIRFYNNNGGDLYNLSTE